ncbi:hypothetical protein H4R33_001634 [Dimargaris cristalligena]|uniref:Uncharacterized protein n=1 Tax=Dimargaris cristalligena TaxID=215637 RepID=A0A4P9ZTE8_9FUNG|nr:hypothetical protein H4R33_001634 [Dimargaris cristalligena]RKP36111.1 hypothetical protein BJ085DRAFT_35099 [Dimargaris cristalligena]|eukprot:RKP36111.1 hypothetical protein BJ085DRAFT_35099 [Dimargaris cristalligena]
MTIDRISWCSQGQTHLYSTDPELWRTSLQQHPERIEVWQFFTPPSPSAALSPTATQTLPGLPYKTLQDWVDGLVEEGHFDSALQLLDGLQGPGFVPSDSTLLALLQCILDPGADADLAGAMGQYLRDLFTIQRQQAHHVFLPALGKIFGESGPHGFWSLLGRLVTGTDGKVDQSLSDTAQEILLELLVNALHQDMLANQDATSIQNCQLLRTFPRLYDQYAVTHIQPALDSLLGGCARPGLSSESNALLHQLLHMLVILAFVNLISMNSLVSPIAQWLQRQSSPEVQWRFVETLQSPTFKVILLDTLLQNECSGVGGTPATSSRKPGKATQPESPPQPPQPLPQPTTRSSSSSSSATDTKTRLRGGRQGSGSSPTAVGNQRPNLNQLCHRHFPAVAALLRAPTRPTTRRQSQRETAPRDPNRVTQTVVLALVELMESYLASKWWSPRRMRPGCEGRGGPAVINRGTSGTIMGASTPSISRFRATSGSTSASASVSVMGVQTGPEACYVGLEPAEIELLANCDRYIKSLETVLTRSQEVAQFSLTNLRRNLDHYQKLFHVDQGLV